MWKFHVKQSPEMKLRPAASISIAVLKKFKFPPKFQSDIKDETVQNPNITGRPRL